MKKKAFTLIELVVVLGIISIILTIGIVKFNVIHKLKANQEVNTMINDINHAKVKAMATGYDFSVILIGNTYQIRPTGNKNLSEWINRETSYLSFNNQKTEIIYKPSGSVANAGTVRFYLTDNLDSKKLYKLVVTVAGGQTYVKEDKEGLYIDGDHNSSRNPSHNSHYALTGTRKFN